MSFRVNPRHAAPPLAALYKLWCGSISYSFVNFKAVDPRHGPLVMALWHDELFPLPWLASMTPRRLVTVVSQSRDGELLAQVLARFNLATARGSSSRGGLRALLKMAKCMREERRDAVITVDGPRGPRHKPKPGAIYLAHKAKAKLLPVRMFLSNRLARFDSWDQFQLPMPFSECRIVLGDPYEVGDVGLEGPSMEKELERLEYRLDELSAYRLKERG